MTSAQTMTELLPCPFCGHSATFFEMKEWSLYVSCVECEAEMNVTGDSRKVAAQKWNTRVPSFYNSAEPWDAHYNRTYGPVETLAKEIYDFFEYKDSGTKPAWVPGGNSLMQDEARICARKQLRDAGHIPAVSRLFA